MYVTYEADISEIYLYSVGLVGDLEVHVRFEIVNGATFNLSLITVNLSGSVNARMGFGRYRCRKMRWCVGVRVRARMRREAAAELRTERVSERALQKAPKPDWCAGGVGGGLPLGRSMSRGRGHRGSRHRGPAVGGRRSTAGALHSRPRVT